MTRVAVFRPDDHRIEDARRALERRGYEVVADPLLEVEPTGREARVDADYLVLTSVTGAALVDDPRGRVCAIGPKTAEALRRRGHDVYLVPEEHTSDGIVSALSDEVDGARVEVARSDHGSDVLVDGLEEAGAYVHETVLYRLRRPEGAGERTRDALDADELDAVLFTSSLTVEHLVRSVEPDALDDVVAGVIGPPTRDTAVDHGVDVDFVAADATFESLVEGLERELPAE
ncbi:MAG: uroporphyrinogen-III synthase [Halobacteriota archaeon]